MDRSIAMLVIGLIFGGGIGFVIAAGNGVTLDGHDHGGHDAGAAQMAAHSHEDILALADEGAVPELAIELTRDPMSGWNLHLSVTNFRFAPENASQPHVPGQGHAHVYVNGAKIARMYGEWMHIASLPEGASVEVTLNANDHRPLAVGDQPLEAIVLAH